MIHSFGYRRLAGLVVAAAALVPMVGPSAVVLDAAPDAEFVIQISVDGLRSDALTSLGASRLPNFYRLRNEGITTDNARTDYDYTNTLPNHGSMLTGRPVEGPEGHGMTLNTDEGQSIHVDSIFDVVESSGLTSAMYASKDKFAVFERSWKGAIDFSLINTDESGLAASLVHDMATKPYSYSFVHFSNPDEAGHSSGWMGSDYLDAVVEVDSYLGDILDLIDESPILDGKTVIILTADHGGTETSHSDAAVAAHYTIPFYVWGAGVASGGDLYAVSSATRSNPGKGRPDNSASVQPIRSSDVANLAADFLGLPPVAGSMFNFAQDLAVKHP